MATVLFAGLWLAYGGMLALCMGMERHFKQVWQRLPAPLLRRGLRVGGWLALGLSLVASVAAWGWAMGPVGWFGMLSLAGFGLVLLLPYQPRLAAWLPLASAPLLALIGLLT
ncbi:hypothetical protein PSm6_06710 [Pseudomonas solani]|uniref:DUF3325 domain-containing protein n=1 Tax=Pseudomonas solani TaxID=2731552 RepID=A0ABM7L464_9PSED|nr:DUF3325 domain-containing protein [Pseudomonas solani]EQM67313.1 hypothetical protein L682_23015 [Pseudomonas alcaligenes OT 69]MDN4144905.1 DUF3325 domain-containing protein [Pseudomonas tohonis]BCD84264.1 hypothetical protein PSm6_06710 [Pseudomonas solani]